MKTKSIIAVSVLALSVVSANFSPVFARQGADDTLETEVHTSTSGSTEVEVHSSVQSSGQNRGSGSVSSSLRDDLKTEVETKRAEVRQKVEDKKAEVKEKLADKRLDVCKKREVRINAIIDKTAIQAEKHLGVFEKIEDRVKSFYADKHLTVANYDALVAAVDEKHTSAVAAVEELKSNDFSCDTTDATNPSGIMKDLALSKNDALKEYRSALKDLISAVKSAANSTDNSETSGEAN
jgi:hypothetical protein